MRCPYDAPFGRVVPTPLVGPSNDGIVVDDHQHSPTAISVLVIPCHIFALKK